MTRFWKLLLVLGLLGSLTAPAAAQTRQEPDADIDDEEEEPGLPAGARPQTASTQPLVEVARGVYVQADAGAFDYLGLISQGSQYLANFGQALYWGPSLRLHAGMDIITGQRFGLSAQATFWQVVNNGIPYTPDLAPTSPAQGDTRSYLLEAAVRPTLLLGESRRLNLFTRFSAGVGILGQALSKVPQPGIYSSLEYGIVPKPFVSAGFGLEYYTRLSHFSIIFFEVNALYMLGLDVALGVNFVGFKYTF